MEPDEFFTACIPYNLKNRILFWLTYCYQNYGNIVGSQAAVASDTFIMAMILKMCAQMEILAYRMQIFPELCKTKYIKYPEMEQKILCDWIKQHESLYK